MGKQFGRGKAGGRAGSCGLETLEERRLLAAPAIDYIPDVEVPGGKGLLVPVTASDADGDALIYSITRSNTAIRAYVHRAVFLRMTVQNFGVMEFALFPEIAPKAVDVITSLARAEYYNNVQFHRVIKDFMIQGGDKAGTGSGYFPHRFEDEYHPQVVFSGYGQLAMANSGNDTNGSQFFITTSSPRHLDFNHTIFGQLVRGKSVLQAIAATPVAATNDKPITPVIISKVEVVENRTDAVLRIVAPAGQTGTVTVRASDGTSLDRETFAVTGKADATNTPPYMLPMPLSIPWEVNKPIVLDLPAFDAEGDPIYWDGTFVGAVHALNPRIEGNRLTMLPEKDYRGPITVKLGVKVRNEPISDSNPLLDEQVVTIAMGDRAITAATGLTAPGVVGKEGTYTLATFRDADPEGKAGDYTASIYWGDGTVTAGMVTKSSRGVFSVTGKHTYTSEGDYAVYVKVTGNLGSTVEIRGVGAVADAPLKGRPLTIVGYAGQAITGAVVATFTDGDPNGVLSDFTCRIEWGDGTRSPGTIELAPGGGGFRVRGTHTYATAGEWPITVRIWDKGGSRAVVHSRAIVGRASLTVDADDNRTIAEQDIPGMVNYSAQGSFADASATATSWTGTVDWGDGSPVEALAINQAAKTFNLAHNYANSGTYRVTVVIYDQTGQAANSGNDAFDVTVFNVAPTATITKGHKTGVRGQLRKVSFSASDVSPADVAHGFRFQVDWGDGTPVEAFALGVTSATHAYNNVGSFTIKVRAIDKDGSISAEATRKITISAAELQAALDGSAALDLVAGGTTGNDTMEVAPAPEDPTKVIVKIRDATVGPFAVTGRIRLFGNAGNDAMSIKPGVRNWVELYGEAGNDTLTGGLGDDVLVGGPGDDVLVGSAGRDVLVGGLGKDNLNGGSGEDLLIGGTTSFDADGGLGLGLVLSEWYRRDLSYAKRLAHLFGSGTGRNGSAVLTAATVQNDYAVDRLVGANATDAFFASTPFAVDRVIDRESGETLKVV